jgi:FMN reductase
VASKSTNANKSVSIVGICGSLRPGSYSRLALDIALSGAQEAGAVTRVLDLLRYDLVFCTGTEDNSSYPEGVARLRTEVREARGIILATPNYHGTFSGVLKNALDLMSKDEFEGKVVGLVGVSGGRMGGAATLNSLRAIGHALNSWVVPQEAWVLEAWKAFDKNGRLIGHEHEARLKEVGRQVTRLVYLSQSPEVIEALRLWEGAAADEEGSNRT